MKLLRIACAVLALTAAVSACQLKDDDSSRPATGDGPPPIPAPADLAAPPASAHLTPSGIASKIIIVGMGSIHPTTQHRVTVHYAGWSTDGKNFDNSYKNGQPTTFRLDEVIPGWTEGLQLMVIGEKRRFWIPGHLAYDNDPRPGVPKGMLVFDIELLDIK